MNDLRVKVFAHLQRLSLGFFTDAWGIRAVMALPLLGTVMVVLLLVAIWAEAHFMSAPRVLK